MKINDRDRRKLLDASVEGLFEERITRQAFIRRATAWGISTVLLSDILALHGKAFAAEHPSPEVLEKIKNGKGAYGFNAATEEFEDLIKAGIVDPTKVVRCALQNAASVSGLLITTEAMIADKPEKKKETPPMPHEDY